MAMSAANSGSLTNEINVTPMIDVLLVLLIIFMLVIPLSRKVLDVQLPDPTPAPATTQPNDQIVLEIGPGPTYKVNTQPVAPAALPARLKQIYTGRPDKIIFIKGAPSVKYQDVIVGMDVARGAGVLVIGVPPKDAAK